MFKEDCMLRARKRRYCIMQSEETKLTEKSDIVRNSKLRDNGGKIIFNDPILCAQFVRDYVKLPFLQDVRPEDIEDVSERFVTLYEEERNADTVKRIKIQGEEPFYLISLIEHKISVDYNVGMQIFRYMSRIWEDYAKEMEKKQKGITRRKDFQYPLILPIVYYEGKQNWTAPIDFKSRIKQGEVFEKYVPDFQYYLVPICNYTNQELLEKADEISLVMLFNKMQSKEDIEEFRKISPKQVEEILKDTPKHLRELIGKVFKAYLLKANVPVEEAEELVEMVEEKKMAELFGNMEKMDIQAERRNTQEQRERAEKAEARAEMAEARNEKAILLYIENCYEFGLSREAIISRVIDKFEIDEELVVKILDSFME